MAKKWLFRFLQLASEQNYAHSTADYHISNVIASDILKTVGINVVYETGIHVSNILDLMSCVLQKSKWNLELEVM